MGADFRICSVSRHGQAYEVSRCAARNQKSARTGWVANQLLEPGKSSVFDQYSTLVVASDMTIHCCCKHLGNAPDRTASAHHPSPKSWMDVASWVRQYVFLKRFIYRTNRLTCKRKWL